ncbi:MAG: ATP-binding cassette domain-containing protein [Oscillospiraceae bacterium]|jgi:Fe-S cluster assembly ATP-binding protein|nr:ATP-binding cassette domain-containing protein [Oscillospiraceae bacterium]
MLELQNISFDVNGDSGKKEILHDINLTIEDASFVVITGPNGGGKSTLAKLIAGIEKPTSGKIIFDGEDITELNATERAQAGIGFAFQQPVRFKGLTVHDLLSLAAGRDLNTDEACVYLSEVGLCARDYVTRELNASLSGGELKRIEIAMLIARGTMLSVFDEPEAGIDLWSFQNLIRVFTAMRDATNGAVVIISHQERILEIANKIVVIAGGHVTGIGSKEEILPGLLGQSDACAFYRGVVSL